MLPGYQEMMKEERKNKKLREEFAMSFLIADIIISILAVGGFFVIRFTDTFTPRASNVSKYCDDPSYYVSPIPELSYAMSYATIIMAFSLCYLTLLTTSTKYSMEQLIKDILMQTWILGVHLVFLSIFIELLKCAVGFPRPYFFSTENITSFYCESEKESMPFSLQKLDNELRKSFPSHRSAIYAYCITFMYTYLLHFDLYNGQRVFEQVLIMITASWLTYFQFCSWEYGENHLSDIIGGLSIGTICAFITVRSMFGSVFYSPIRVFILEKKNNGKVNPSAKQKTYGKHQSGYNILPSKQTINGLHTLCDSKDSELKHLETIETCESTQTDLADDTHHTTEENSTTTKSVLEIQNQKETAVMINVPDNYSEEP